MPACDLDRLSNEELLRRIDACMSELSTLRRAVAQRGVAGEASSAAGNTDHFADLDTIRSIVALHFRVPESEICAANSRPGSRAGRLAEPRKLLYFLALEFTRHSQQEIGRYVDRTHGAVSSGASSVRDHIDTCAEYRAVVANLRRQVTTALSALHDCPDEIRPLPFHPDARAS